MTDFEKQIAFIKEIDKLKFIFRKTCLLNSDRHENSAEHSWHLAMMAIALENQTKEKVNIGRVIKMLLIHDIVEIDAGDTFLFDTQKNHENTDEELAAAKRIFGLLPDALAHELTELWTEFELAESEDAKFAKAIDRLAPMMQNDSNHGGTWREFDVPYETVIEKKKRIEESSDTLWKYGKSLIDNYYKK